MPVLDDIRTAFIAHNWLLLLMVVAVYARKLCSPASAFPISIPANWRPSVTAFFGLVIAVVASLQAGKSAGEAALAGVTVAASTGFLDGLIAAIFGAPANAPAWAKAIVFVFDDVAGTGQAQQVEARSPVPTPEPPAPKKSHVGLVPPLVFCFLALACLRGVTGCAWFGSHGAQVAVDVGQLTACVLEHDQEPVAQIAVDCGGLAVSDVEAILSAHRAAMSRDLGLAVSDVEAILSAHRAAMSRDLGRMTQLAAKDAGLCP